MPGAGCAACSGKTSRQFVFYVGFSQYETDKVAAKSRAIAVYVCVSSPMHDSYI